MFVAEQFVASKLREQGHEVEFPETSNQAGYDIIVDGQEMQVKCVSSISLLKDHFDKYPDIPAFTNSELAEKVLNSGEDFVDKVHFIEGYSLDTIEDLTEDTLDAGADIFDHNIPLLVTVISGGRNFKRWWQNNAFLTDALGTFVGEVGSKAPLGIIGEFVGEVAGTLIFGPAGGVVFGGVVAIASAAQSRRIVAKVKKLINRTNAENLERANSAMLDALETGLIKKTEIIKEKIDQIQQEDEISVYVKKRRNDDLKYFTEKLNEVKSHKKRTVDDPVDSAIKVMEFVRTSKVHPVLFQKELTGLFTAFEKANKFLG